MTPFTIYQNWIVMMEHRNNKNSCQRKFLFVFIVLFINTCCFVQLAHSRFLESTGDGTWITPETWTPVGPIAGGDTVIILSGHTITVNGNENDLGVLFIVIQGTLDLRGGGKLTMDVASMVIIEAGGTLYADGSQSQITIGPGGAEFSGTSTITGASYIIDGHTPVSGEGLPPGYSPLPVELLYFNANPTQDQVNLNWSRASELNNDFFTLEKSNDGRDFVTLGEVTGNGTTNLQMDYSFTDHSPYLGLSYYRLSQTDYDGTTEIFPVVSVLFEGDRRFSVHPNPVSGSFITLKISTMGNHELLELKIIDLQGRLVERKQLKTDNFGNIDTEFQLQKPLPKGAYVFELISEKNREYQKVVAE